MSRSFGQFLASESDEKVDVSDVILLMSVTNSSFSPDWSLEIHFHPVKTKCFLSFSPN